MKMVRTALVLLLLLVTSGIDAQKIDQRLTRLVEQTVQRRAQGLKPIDGRDVNKTIAVNYDKDGTITTLSAIATLKEGAECPTEELEQMGIRVRFVLGDMVAMVIPVDKLMALEDVEELKVVEADEMRSLQNDKARVETGVDSVNTAAVAELQKLPKAYTGEGVVLGIIDSGIDYNHAAFKDANGNSRVKLLLEYSEEESALLRYTGDEITKRTVDTNDGSHGTHTSASAGGSATDNGMQGMAPQAELVLCGLGNKLSSTNIIESMKAIFEYADKVQKPAVISISLGKLIGLHDGSDYITKTVAELTENGTKEGRAVLISAGNDARNQQSIVSKLPAEDIIEGYKLMTVLGAAKYPTDDNPDQKVTYDANYLCYFKDNNSAEQFIGFALVNLKTGALENIEEHTRTVKDNNLIKKDDFGRWQDFRTINGETKHTFFINLASAPIYLDNSDLRLALYVKGNAGNTIVMLCDGKLYDEPCFDAPQDKGYDFAKAGYTKGCSDMTACTEVCSDCVISVGSHITRTIWTNYDNKSYNYIESKVTNKKQVVGEISDYSSYCVADDNDRPRPMVLSPGQGIISAASNYDKDYFIEGQPGVPNNDKRLVTLCGNVEKFDRKNWYILSQGTSMSTPIAAGIVTLWMQANNKLTVNEIKNIMKETGVKDKWTSVPENIPSKQIQQAGEYGKIDCLAGLKIITGTTAIETISADGHREATPASMYNVDAPVYNMMGQRVDKSQKGLVIYKGRKYLNR